MINNIQKFVNVNNIQKFINAKNYQMQNLTGSISEVQYNS